MLGEFRVFFVDFQDMFKMFLYVSSFPFRKNMVPKPVFQDGLRLRHSNQLYYGFNGSYGPIRSMYGIFTCPLNYPNQEPTNEQ